MPAFLNALKLPANKHIGTAILSWSARHNDQDTLSPDEIESLWASTKLKPPSNCDNLRRDLRAAAKEGWIKSHGSRAELTFQALGYTHKTVDGWKAPEDG